MIGLPKVSFQLNQNKEVCDLLELTSELCDTPIALLTLLGEQLKYVRSDIDFHIQVKDAFQPFLSRTTPELYMLYEIQHGEAANGSVDTGLPACVQFYASLPLITANGLFLGSLCVMDTKPRVLSDSQQKLIALTAGRIMDAL